MGAGTPLYCWPVIHCIASGLLEPHQEYRTSGGGGFCGFDFFFPLKHILFLAIQGLCFAGFAFILKYRALLLRDWK